MNQLPKVSVIIPVYNVEKYLIECLKSIVNQSYKNLEIILVDDGSPDNSGKICDEYATCDTRIKVIHKENGGVSCARNVGLDLASGEYICFVDPDDWLEYNALELCFTYLLITKADLCFFDYDLVYRGGVTVVELQSQEIRPISRI